MITKIIAWTLLGAFTVQAAVRTFVDNEKQTLVIVGTPEQVYEYVKSGSKIPADLEALKDVKFDYWVSYTDTLSVNGTSYANFSEKFDNKEGFNNKQQLKQWLKQKLESDYNRILNKVKKKALNKLENTGIRLSEQEINRLIMQGIQPEIEFLQMIVQAYTCPMGGSKDLNDSLSKFRADEIKSVLIEVIQEFMKESFGYKEDSETLNQLIKSVGAGPIYDNSRVKDVCDSLKQRGYSVDYSKLRKGDSSEEKKFDQAMKDLKQKDPAYFAVLKQAMYTLRKADVIVKIKVHVKIGGFEVAVKESMMKGDAIVNSSSTSYKPPTIVEPPPERRAYIANQMYKLIEKRTAYPYTKQRKKNMPRSPGGNTIFNNF